MTHPPATPRSLRNVASVVATLLGQAFAEGPDRAPILPKTHAAPAPSSPSGEVADPPPCDEALLALFDAHGPGGMPPTEWAALAQRVRAVLCAATEGRPGVHPDGHHQTLAPPPGRRDRSP